MKNFFGVVMVLLILGFTAHGLVVQAAIAGPQCSDGIDNDGDTFSDIDDPQCHIDGNASNIDSFDPSIEQEIDTSGGCVGCGPRPIVTNNGGGGGSHVCSDELDNDGDGLVDEEDPGCHNDGDAGNPDSHIPRGKSELNTTITPAVLGVTQTACGVATGRPCMLQKTGGMTPERIATNNAAIAFAQKEGNSLFIQKLGINKPILQLKDISGLRSQFWILPWTSTPDKGGNTVIVGHAYNNVNGRYSRSTLFELDTLKIGDEIVMNWKGIKYTYLVTENKKVNPDQIEIEDQTKNPTLTIYSCGRFTNKDRTVVVAILKV